MFIQVDENTNKVILISAKQTKDATIEVASVPEVAEGYHLEYKGGKVIVIDDRIEQVSALRKAAYIERVDPITAEIERLKEMGGTEDEIEAARQRRAEAVAAIKSEYPYPEEETLL